jgi:hypothetical protein
MFNGRIRLRLLFSQEIQEKVEKDVELLIILLRLDKFNIQGLNHVFLMKFL